MQFIDDRYELLEVIASGGMATVWRAHDRRLDRLVAIKRPHPSAPDSDAPARLAREARAAASLNHPNLITIHDFGEDESGPYLVMELVEGPTLAEASDELTTLLAIELGAQLADALTAIHEAGLVHRDVKPSNIIMSERGPLLTDFGIAIDPDATSRMTQPGIVVATPSYAAPEVLAGATPSSASDVYSLALLVDELVRHTGTKPDAATERIMSSAMATSPDQRPSARDLANALGSAQAIEDSTGEQTTRLLAAPAPPPLETTENVEPTRPSGVALAAAGLSLLAVGLIIVGLATSDDDTSADARVVASSTTTASPDTTTSTSTSTTVELAPTTSMSPATRLAEIRDQLEAELSRPPRSGLNPPEVADLMKWVDEAIAAAGQGDTEKAEERLSEVDRRLRDKLEGERLDQARWILFEIAAMLDVEIDEEGGRADDERGRGGDDD